MQDLLQKRWIALAVKLQLNRYKMLFVDFQVLPLDHFFQSHWNGYFILAITIIKNAKRTLVIFIHINEIASKRRMNKLVPKEAYLIFKIKVPLFHLLDAFHGSGLLQRIGKIVDSRLICQVVGEEAPAHRVVRRQPMHVFGRER